MGPAVGGAGAGWMAQVLPFQCSASDTVCPLAFSYSPAAVHSAALAQDTARTTRDPERPNTERWQASRPSRPQVHRGGSLRLGSHEHELQSVTCS